MCTAHSFTQLPKSFRLTGRSQNADDGRSTVGPGYIVPVRLCQGGRYEWRYEWKGSKSGMNMLRKQVEAIQVRKKTKEKGK